MYVPLDVDNSSLPSDWYLQVAAETSKVLKGETPLGQEFPLSLTSQPRSVCD
jgi:hypothetical protein